MHIFPQLLQKHDAANMQHRLWLSVVLLLACVDCRPSNLFTVKERSPDDGRSRHLFKSIVYSREARSLGDGGVDQLFTSNVSSPGERSLGDDGGQLSPSNKSSPEETSLGDDGGQLSTSDKSSPEDTSFGDSGGQLSTNDKSSPAEQSLDGAGHLSSAVLESLQWETGMNTLFTLVRGLGDELLRKIVRTVSSFVGRYTMKGLLKVFSFTINGLIDLTLPLIGQEKILQGNGTLAMVREAVNRLEVYLQPYNRTWLREVTSSADYAAYEAIQEHIAVRLAAVGYVAAANGLFNVFGVSVPEGGSKKVISSAMSSFSPWSAISFAKFLTRIPYSAVYPFTYLAKLIF